MTHNILKVNDFLNKYMSKKWNVFIDENQKVFITLIGDDNKEYTGLVSKGKLVFKDEDWAKLSDFKRYKL